MAVCLLLTTLSVWAQNVRTIKLKPQKGFYNPESYFINKVVDDRDDTANIGIMRAGFANKPAEVNLQDGAASAVNHFLAASLQQDPAKDNIELHIIRMRISEKNAGMRQQADLDFGVAFYDGDQKLIEYTGSAYVQTGLDASAYIAQLIKQNLERALREFDTWYAANHANTSAAVSTEVIIENSSDNKDLIIYNPNKPLTLSDFEGKIDDLSIGAAATYSGIGMRYTHQRQGKGVILKVYILAYFDRTKSWAKAQGRNAKTLNHEQRHFDITATKACELAETIKQYPFSLDNYGTELDELLRQTDKQTSEMQRAYDSETGHGTNAAQQATWNNRLKTLLTDKNCY